MSSAVFISYAHEDTGAARRIAESLRNAGVEVWFDQNELRGGDAWDRKIRHQIDACTLFIPLISTHTEARAKGYFRLEWKLAVEQTHLMADGVPFLAPVVVDGTSEKSALVPAEFLKVQWTRLPGGEPTAAFVAQVQRLLGARNDHATATPALVSANAPAAKAGTSASPSMPATTRSWPWFALGSLAAAAALAWFAFRPTTPSASSPPTAAVASTSDARAQSPSPAPRPMRSAERRVAVLGFSYLSEDRSKEYYADAVREVLLTALGKVPGLQVVSYASPARDVSDAEAARKANAEYLVKGAVQTLGDRLRITARLVRGADGVEVWSENFTRELRDFITVQDQIAALVADHLSLKLGTRPAAAPVNPAAFQLYLEGRLEWNKRTPGGFALAQEKFEQAIALDPKFARAYSGLADVWYLREDGGTSSERRQRAQEYVEKALATDEGLAEAHTSLGQILRDPAAKEAAYRRAIELNPSYASARHWYGMFLMGQARLGEAVNQVAVAEKLDPLSHRIASAHALTLLKLGRWAEALAAAERALALDPSFNASQQHQAHALIGLGRKEEAVPIARALAERLYVPGIAMLALAGDRENAGRLARQLFENRGRTPTGGWFEIYAALNWVDEGFRFLESDGVRLTNSGYVLYTEMTFDSVRNDPRFEAALSKFDLLDKYRAAWAAAGAWRKTTGSR